MSYSTPSSERPYHASRSPLLGAVLATMLGMLNTGCSGEAAPAADDPQQIFNELHDGTTATLATGESFQIHVSTNASTGYSWEFALSAPDIVAHGSTDFVGTDGPAGSSATRVDTYECLQPGEVQLDGYYFRPWEVDGLPEQSDFTLTLVVQ